MSAEVDVAVVGAGAAGIAAGRVLADTNASFLILEASGRIGGRAHTVIVDSQALDLGCGWFHSADRNPWRRWAEANGFAIDRTPPAWGQQLADLGFTRNEQAKASGAWDAFDRRMREDPPASDCAADALAQDGPWNPYLQARSGYVNGAQLGQISVADYLAYDDADTGVNWRTPSGYGAVVAAAARGLPIRLDCPVRLMDWSDRRIQLTCDAGTIAARRVIIAVPTSVLARGDLEFRPQLPAVTEAAAALPLGLADKLFLHLDAAEEFPPDRQLIGNPHSAETGSYYLRPFGRPLIEAFFGGAGAENIEAAGPEGGFAFAIEELVALFGTAFRNRLRPLAGSAWKRERFVRGSYSHALPGHAAARGVLAAPVEERLFFAGEACSAQDFSTAHGAFETGERAARAALASLTRV